MQHNDKIDTAIDIIYQEHEVFQGKYKCKGVMKVFQMKAYMNSLHFSVLHEAKTYLGRFWDNGMEFLWVQWHQFEGKIDTRNWKSGSVFVYISFWNFVPIFIVFVVALFLSLMVFLVEYYWNIVGWKLITLFLVRMDSISIL